jgi:hypothetical protein
MVNAASSSSREQHAKTIAFREVRQSGARARVAQLKREACPALWPEPDLVGARRPGSGRA